MYISDDGSKDAYLRTFEKMGWMSLPFEQQATKLQLKKMFGINGIPHLHVVSAHDGRAVEEDASDLIQPDNCVEIYSGWLKKLVASSCE